MTPDEDHGVHGEHVVEIPNEFREPRSARRRSFATMSVAVCLALAGAVTAYALLRDQSETASEKERDAARREQLIDGWTTLGAVAAQHAQDEMRAPAAQAPANGTASPAAAPAPVQNVIIVGSQPQTAQPLPAAGATASNTAASPPVTVTSPGSPTATPGSPTVTSPASARTVPGPEMPAPVGVPAPPSAPNQTPRTPAPGSPDTVLSPVTYPASQSCGLTTCNVDSVCCNVSCGICTAPGEGCSQTQCG